MKALLTNYHQSPRKVRLVANLIRGKSVAQAKSALAFLPKKSSPAISKLLDSALVNARSAGFSENDLVVAKITVDKGTVMRRFKPMARGRAAAIHKTMSIIFLELAKKKSASETELTSVSKRGAKKPLATRETSH